MRTRMSVLAVLAIFGGVACGDDGKGADTSAPPVTTPAVVTTPAANTTTVATTVPIDTAAMLLTASDLGAGWKVGEDINEMDLASFAQVPCANTALNPTIVARLTAVAGAQFEGADNPQRHLMNLIVTGTPGRLSADLEALFGGLVACPVGDPTTVAPLTIPDLGDQHHAVTMFAKVSATSPTVWHVRLAIVRVGGVAVELGLTEILAAADAPPTVTDAEFVAFLEAAVAKLSR